MTPEEDTPEGSWHPDGADVPWWLMAALLAVTGGPILLAVYVITTLR